MSKWEATRSDEQSAEQSAEQSIPPGVRRPIRVVVVDDHPLVLQSLHFALLGAPDLELVGEAADGETAIQVCDAVQPDVVLLDLRLPGLSINQTIRALRHHPPVPVVLIYTADYEEQLVKEAIRAGASGYVVKQGPVGDLLTAIRAAYEHHHTQA